ncbi:MAG: sugar ABC transporter permease [Clostridia bacterium]|nr:sugar ABC transporter permease [Clostridia bacterium]
MQPTLLGKSSWQARFFRYMKSHWVFYLFLLPALLDVFIFKYIPMYGIQIAFRNFKIKQGFLGSEWTGFKYFIQFIEAPNFVELIGNTILLSLYTIIFTFPVPIILAFMINEIRNLRLKKTAQMLTYMPHFISMVAVAGLISLFLDRESGIVNIIIKAMGGEQVAFLGMSSAFRPIYVISEIWQHSGWNSIIYLSALAAVDMESIEAARIDGANRIQKIMYIDVPTILPTIIILLIMRVGTVLNVGFEKVYLLQNDLNRDVSEVISTYTYRLGILGGQFSLTTAIGLFNNIINAIVLLLVNGISRKVSDTSLF